MVGESTSSRARTTSTLKSNNPTARVGNKINKYLYIYIYEVSETGTFFQESIIFICMNFQSYPNS